MTDLDSSATEADRRIAGALADQLRTPAPRRLHERLARSHRPRRAGPWIGWVAAFAAGAAVAGVGLVTWLPAHQAPGVDVIAEAVDDHLRVISAQHPLEVESSDFHQVKPWFAGKLEFVPPVGFLGDEEFPLRGGSIALFLGHRAATFVYQRRLHTVSLFVYPRPEPRPRVEATRRGFHVVEWANDGAGFALVSDVSWPELRLLEARLRR